MEYKPRPENLRPLAKQEPIQRLQVASEQSAFSNTTEVEQPPEWLKQVVQQIGDAWFDPKSFEEHPGFYEKFGIRKFKKYLPTDLMMQLVWKKLLGMDEGVVKKEDISSLKDWETFTRIYETAHLAGFAAMNVSLGIFLGANNMMGAGLTLAANILMNVYPIMLQRYNRVRLYRTINKLESKTGNT